MSRYTHSVLCLSHTSPSWLVSARHGADRLPERHVVRQLEQERAGRELCQSLDRRVALGKAQRRELVLEQDARRRPEMVLVAKDDLDQSRVLPDLQQDVKECILQRME